MTALPAYLVRGDQPVLLGDAVRAVVAELVGAGDPSLLTEELAFRYQGLVVKSKEDRDYLRENMDYVVRFANADNPVFDDWVETAMAGCRTAAEEEDEVLVV